MQIIPCTFAYYSDKPESWLQYICLATIWILCACVYLASRNGITIPGKVILISQFEIFSFHNICWFKINVNGIFSELDGVDPGGEKWNTTFNMVWIQCISFSFRCHISLRPFHILSWSHFWWECWHWRMVQSTWWICLTQMLQRYCLFRYVMDKTKNIWYWHSYSGVNYHSQCMQCMLYSI